jgi:hypothetical protein
MHATVRSYTTTDVAQVSRLVREEVLPQLTDTDGFLAFYAIDSGDGRMMTVTVCRDRKAAEASNAQAADWVKHRFSSLVSQPTIVTGEVTAHHIWNEE